MIKHDYRLVSLKTRFSVSNHEEWSILAGKLFYSSVTAFPVISRLSDGPA